MIASSPIFSAETSPKKPTLFIPERMTAITTHQDSEYPPDFVLFIVHGMGHQNRAFETRGNFHNNLTQFHQVMVEELKKESSIGVHAEIIPIEWHSAFHQVERFGPRMRSITLSSVASIRLIFNDYLSDVPYYFEPSSHVAIADIICTRLNQEWAKFQTRWPDFNGKIHVLGHSLGGCLCFDVMCHQAGCRNTETCRENQRTQRAAEVDHLNHDMQTSWLQWHHPNYHYPILDFVPSTLFTVGSPTGAVHVQRSQDFGKHADLLAEAGIRFYNIFRAMDPLGYRTEPLLHECYQHLEPVSLSASTGTPVSKSKYAETQLIENSFARMPSITLPDFSSAKRSWSFAFDRVMAAAKRAVGGEPPMEVLLGESTVVADFAEPGTVSDASLEVLDAVKESDSGNGIHVDLIETNARQFDETLQKVVSPVCSPESSDAIEPPSTRLDYVIYPNSGIVNSFLPEFLTGMRSHFGYWDDADLMRHLLSVMVPKK